VVKPVAPPGRSRRALLGGATAALAGAASLTLSGCGAKGRTGAHSVRQARTPVREADITLLQRLLDLERHTVAAYTAGIPLLGHDDAKTAKQFLNEELQHTGELISLITAAGGDAPPRRAPFALGDPAGATGVLELLHGLERTQIVAYIDTIPRLSPGPVRAAASTILASDAQHIAFLRRAQGTAPLAGPFLTGAQ
jgi:hypothetical protein